MASVELAPEVAQDLDRVVSHLRAHDVANLPGRLREIIAALSVLEHAPEIGRPAAGGLRELVFGRGAKAYVALYRYVERLDLVVVLALRAAREAGYAR